MPKLSVLIPARNEEFLQQTIDDVFRHIEADTEVLVGLDGYHDDILERPNLRVFETSDTKGQRSTQNALARQSDAKFLIKLDAHVSMSQGFDRVMLEIMEANPNIVLIPAIGNLHVYDWICPQGHRTYQGANVVKCSLCDSKELTKDIVWKINGNSLYSDFFFDKDLIFQLGDKNNPKLLNEIMMVQGSGFCVSKENYIKWNLCDESWSSWGQMGLEIALKTWANGGKLMATRKAFMGHFFRKEDEFPYERKKEDIDLSYRKSQELSKENSEVVKMLVKKFNYPGNWIIEKKNGKI